MRNLSSNVFWIFIFTSTLSFSQNSTIANGASLFGDLTARHIGPALMSGRINVYFPFSMSQGEKGKPGEPISMTAIVLNPKVDDAEFTFPEKK